MMGRRVIKTTHFLSTQVFPACPLAYVNQQKAVSTEGGFITGICVNRMARIWESEIKQLKEDTEMVNPCYKTNKQTNNTD